MGKTLRQGIIAMTAVLSLASCGVPSLSSSDTSSATSVTSSAFSAESASSSLADVDDSLPSYEKTDRMSSYISDDNYRDYYAIFVPSFADSDGDGIGDLNGITAKLDYLRDKDNPHGPGSLGIDAIYLSPIFKGLSYHKYDVTDYEEIDPSFGTMSDFSNLISQAHERGIKVILDLVLNHASTANSYFLQALSDLQNDSDYDAEGRPTADFVSSHPEVDYFRFIRDGYSFDDYSNRLYTAVNGWDFEGFSNTMPDWNLDNSEVRALHKEYIDFWLKNGADGFRLDAVQSYYGEVSIDINKNFEYINYVNQAVKSYKPDAYIVAEGPWSLAGARAYMTNTDIDSYFDFDTDCVNLASDYGGYINRLRNMSLNKSVLSDVYALSGYESEKNQKHIDAYFNSNHDVGRMTNQFAFKGSLYLQQLKFHYGFQNLFRGNYFMYYGDEIGLMGVKAGSDDKVCRSPFRWGDSYETTPLEPGLNDATEQYFSDIRGQAVDSDSLFNYMRRLTKIKDYNPEIERGEAEISYADDATGIMVIRKTYQTSVLYAVINYGGTATDISLSTLGISGEIRNCLSSDGTYASLSSDVLTLPSLSITLIK